MNSRNKIKKMINNQDLQAIRQMWLDYEALVQ